MRKLVFLLALGALMPQLANAIGLSDESREEFRRVYGCNNCGSEMKDSSYFSTIMALNVNSRQVNENDLTSPLMCRAFKEDFHHTPTPPADGLNLLVQCAEPMGRHAGPSRLKLGLGGFITSVRYGNDAWTDEIRKPLLGFSLLGGFLTKRNLEAVCTGETVENMNCRFSKAKDDGVEISLRGEIVTNGKFQGAISCDQTPGEGLSCQVPHDLKWGFYSNDASYLDIVISNSVSLRAYSQFGIGESTYLTGRLEGPFLLKDYALDPQLEHRLTLTFK